MRTPANGWYCYSAIVLAFLDSHPACPLVGEYPTKPQPYKPHLSMYACEYMHGDTDVVVQVEAQSQSDLQAHRTCGNTMMHCTDLLIDSSKSLAKSIQGRDMHTQADMGQGAVWLGCGLGHSGGSGFSQA